MGAFDRQKVHDSLHVLSKFILSGIEGKDKNRTFSMKKSRPYLKHAGIRVGVGNRIKQESTYYPIQAYCPKFDHQASVRFFSY
jgi:hypothetical protein